MLSWLAARNWNEGLSSSNRYRGHLGPSHRAMVGTMNPMYVYTKALSFHDWHYEYSDDHSVWVRGKDERAALLEFQKQIDPDFAIWNQYAPEGHKCLMK